MERELTGAILEGRYRVIEPVAEGAMGVVYRAERVKLGRIFAIKVLRDVLSNAMAEHKRFEIEAMAMAKLEHPHCASVLDVGAHNGRRFVVMDFIAGANLKDVIATGPQPIPRAAEIMRQVLSGLAHAHEHGIIHRDIKPANVMVSHKTGIGDHVTILDFGLARLLGTGQNLTTGIAVGTPAYMAPEQIRGQKLDTRVDIYACGVVLYELLTGQKPYRSEKDDPIEVCTMHLANPIPRLDDMLPEVEFGELEAVVAKALAKRSDDRYASAQEFAAVLDTAVPRRARTTIPPLPPSGPIGIVDLHRDGSHPSAVVIRSADVLSAMPVAAPQTAVRPARAASPGAFLGCTVTPAAGLPAPGAQACATRRARRSRWWLAGALVAVLGCGAAAAWQYAGRAPRRADDAGSVISAPGQPDPGRDAAARADELVAHGDREVALDLVIEAQKQFPSSAVLPYTAGRIYFSKFHWTEGLKSFRDAIRGDPAYRTDPELIKTVLRGFIMTPGYSDDLAGFLHDDIGGAAQRFLEETARDHPSAATRSRATAELRRYR